MRAASRWPCHGRAQGARLSFPPQKSVSVHRGWQRCPSRPMPRCEALHSVVVIPLSALLVAARVRGTPQPRAAPPTAFACPRFLGPPGALARWLGESGGARRRALPLRIALRRYRVAVAAPGARPCGTDPCHSYQRATRWWRGRNGLECEIAAPITPKKAPKTKTKKTPSASPIANTKNVAPPGVPAEIPSEKPR
jgi:hypothetical protein